MGRCYRIRQRKQRLFQQHDSSCNHQLDPCHPVRGHQDHSIEVICFLRWLKSHGFRNDHRLQVFQYGPTQGRGICARKRSLCVGDTLMELPTSCMMLPSVLRHRFPEFYGHFEIDEDCLIVALLHERSLIDAGRPSEWSPYVNLIPRDYGYLPLMEPNILTRYARLPIPSSYYRLINRTLIDLDRTRARVANIIETNCLSLHYDSDRFNWAYAVVNTRSVHPNPRQVDEDLDGDQTALVPFFDLFNHAPFGNAQVETVIPDGRFKMVTHVGFPKYSQVSCSSPSLSPSPFSHSSSFYSRTYSHNFQFHPLGLHQLPLHGRQPRVLRLLWFHPNPRCPPTYHHRPSNPPHLSLSTGCHRCALHKTGGHSPSIGPSTTRVSPPKGSNH